MNYQRLALPACCLGLIVGAAAPLAAAPQGAASQLIARLGMQRIPDEGAWFAGSYRSDEVLPAQSLGARYGSVPHASGSAIYALVTNEDFSAMHRLQTDEIWHYYAGSPLNVLLLYPDGRSESIVLGPDVMHGQRPQLVVPRGVWQGAAPLNSGSDAYTLFGCTLAPGFEYGDFQIGYRDQLQQQYPAAASGIARLTRSAFATQPVPARAAAVASTVQFDVARSTVVSAADAARIDSAPGIQLRELIGREARFRTGEYSIAQFTLAPGAAMPTSHNKVAEEILLVAAGQGEVTLDGNTSKIAPGSTVVITPKTPHAITAAAGQALVFYAFSIPAFSVDDYVVAPTK